MVDLLDLNKVTHQEKLIRVYRDLAEKRKRLDEQIETVIKELNKADLFPKATDRASPPSKKSGRREKNKVRKEDQGKAKAVKASPGSAGSVRKARYTLTEEQKKKISESKKKWWAEQKKAKEQAKG